MPIYIRLLLLLGSITIHARAQNAGSILLNIGDPAPPLRLRGWVKGEPFEKFERGRVYVLEFWATWCRACNAAMPHLSELAREYEDKVSVLVIDVYEEKSSLEKIKTFVDSMGHRMDLQVAAEDSNFMATGWLGASGEQDDHIPRSFVVNADGRLAWMGYPTQLDEVLPKILNNTWDMKEALAKRNENRRLAALDDSLSFELMVYRGNSSKPGDRGKPESALLLIDEIIKKEPKLKYAPKISSHTFAALLKTNPHKAYEYGKMAIVTPTYEEPNFHLIYGAIEFDSGRSDLPAKIYQLGAEAYQAEIDHRPYPDMADIAALYHKMAAFYWRANDRPKAIDAEQKAIDTLKSGSGFSKKDLAVFESQLLKYKNCD
ncbi:TlpA disulfide reductase family protein [Flavitalea sp. BT771]|uniref:TlpA family protein disulfide reductase n=1 Tax=Flavitalea sp. BT771 TaxID=3063329 RepID=UPI0026E132D9|nr:TlpA disulfide reductase family protein [Flavitalea sp. BT771]MDO6429784.1 TlpA disulfide reductase family protein [Flavitalea sp. BT771]MDV6218088.1 TlpA disulfide reductase family protein [Flavitalea sp. BT771]